MARRKRKKHILFADYFDDWVETYKEGAVRGVTLDKYINTGRVLREIAPKLFLDDLDRREYQRILNIYAETRERQTTIDFHHQVKGCIKDAFHDGLLERDPTYRAIMKGIKPRKKKAKFMNGNDLKKLIGTLELSEGINMDWVILLAAKTGLRFSELLGLTPKDFDFENQLLSIDKTLDYKSTKPKFEPTKNESSKRKIIIDWQIIGQFAPIIKDLPKDKAIFLEDGKRVFNSTYNNHLARKCEKAGVEVITMHSLRHTHASILLAAGVSLHSIAERLGHSDVTTTQETYTHIINELAEKDNAKMISALTSL